MSKKGLVIDMHCFPGFITEILDAKDEDMVKYRREQYYLYKQHIWDLDLFLIQMDAAGVDKAVIAAEDTTCRPDGGKEIVTNEEVKKLVDLAPDRLIGFASVDPHREDAVQVLEKAFGELNLAGLKLSPSMQLFYPKDECARKLYEVCLKYNKPVIFEAGMTWLKNSPMKYSHPLNFEDLAIEYPDLRMCLQHFGWPFTMETAALLLKYPNMYADTGLLYFDSAKQFFNTTFNDQLGEYWIDRSLYAQVMFGSTYPRIEMHHMLEGIDQLKLRPLQKEMVLGKNALVFLGMEE